MALIPHRCRKCSARHSFRHEWDTYYRKKRCDICGHDEFRIDNHRRSGKEKGREACHCDGWWFPHRRGCIGCNFYEGQYEVDDDTYRRDMLKRRVAL